MQTREGIRSETMQCFNYTGNNAKKVLVITKYDKNFGMIIFCEQKKQKRLHKFKFKFDIQRVSYQLYI